MARVLSILRIDSARQSPPANEYGYRWLLEGSLEALRHARAQYRTELGGELIPPLFPSQVQIQTIGGCNARCPMCAMSEPKIRRMQRGRISEALFIKIVDECAQHDECEELALYLQNEPLLDVKLAEKLKAVKVRSDLRLRTRIVTNGSLLDSKRADSFFNAGLDVLSISLNAHTAPTYARVMPGISFDAVIKNIEYVLANSPATLLVTITFIVTRDNEAEIKDALAYWTGRGVLCGAYGMNSMAGTVSHYEELAPSCARERERECYLPIESMAILNNGDVILCCTDWSRNSICGDVRERSIFDVWHADPLRGVRHEAILNRFPHSACRRCPGQTRVMANFFD